MDFYNDADLTDEEEEEVENEPDVAFKDGADAL